MPDVIDAFNNDDNSRGSRLLTATAHRLRWALVVVAILYIPWYLNYDALPLQLAQAAATVILLIGMFHNDFTRMCVRCMEEVPADAPVRAQRQSWLLWLQHFLNRLPLQLGFLAVMAAMSMACKHFGWPRVATLPVDLVWFGWMYGTWLHHRLQPWCPYCRDWGDGGIHEPSPDPVQKATL